MSRGLLVYALVRSATGDPGEPPGAGLAGEPLRLAGTGAVRAVAGLTEMPRPEPAALTAYDAVVRRLADWASALLPARFGQWLADERELLAWLDAHGPELAEALDQVQGCVQMTLRVFQEPDQEPAQELGAPEPAAPSPAAEPPAAGGPGTRYLAARRRAFEREHSLPEIAELRDALRPLLRGERIERPAAPGRLRATVHDLIERGADGDYRRIVDETAPRLAGWRITRSGPWPPYAFAPRPVA